MGLLIHRSLFRISHGQLFRLSLRAIFCHGKHFIILLCDLCTMLTGSSSAATVKHRIRLLGCNQHFKGRFEPFDCNRVS